MEKQRGRKIVNRWKLEKQEKDVARGKVEDGYKKIEKELNGRRDRERCNTEITIKPE